MIPEKGNNEGNKEGQGKAVVSGGGLDKKDITIQIQNTSKVSSGEGTTTNA